FRKFGYKPARGTLKMLQSLARDYKNREQTRDTLQNKLKLLKSQQEHDQKNQKDLEKKLQTLKNKITALQTEVGDLSRRRKDIFGDKDPADERRRLHENIEKAEQQRNQFSQQKQTALLEKKKAESKLDDLRKDIEKFETQYQNLRKKLLERLPDAGFESLDALRKAILPDEIAQKLQTERDQLAQQIAQFENQLQTLRTEHQRIAPLAPSPEQADTLDKQLRQTEQTIGSLQQEIGGINAKLEENQRQREKQAELIRQRDAQQSVFIRWENLRAHIGSADGKVYRSFAQGLTLEQLVHLANHHLQKLSGRYLIRKTPHKDLELQIVDTYQADHIRSLNTLSGGETFLVSLALALGLSDLAGRNTEIRSLFIDEGFGSLDETALDEAISTLENLQAAGKTIGIISHVKELKERISTQIQVIRKAPGVSTLKII
ncbi:MAG: ATP-binding cassette family protein, partial [Bacteroidetes bacterium]